MSHRSTGIKSDVRQGGGTGDSDVNQSGIPTPLPILIPPSLPCGYPPRNSTPACRLCASVATALSTSRQVASELSRTCRSENTTHCRMDDQRGPLGSLELNCTAAGGGGGEGTGWALETPEVDLRCPRGDRRLATAPLLLSSSSASVS